MFLPDPSKEMSEKGNIFYVMNRVISRICEEAAALQAIQTVSVVGGTELYDFPDGFIAERAILPGSTTQLIKLRMDEVVEIKRAGSSLVNATDDPMYYYKWGSQIGFINPSGGAPGSSSTVTLYGWRIPLSDNTEDASETVDPIVDSTWDYCIELGALAMMGGDNVKYEMEFERRKSHQIGKNDVSYRVPVSTDYE